MKFLLFNTIINTQDLFKYYNELAYEKLESKANYNYNIKLRFAIQQVCG